MVLLGLPAAAQTSLEMSPMGTATLISPYYFGPNAFPVPEMLDGRVSETLRVELAADRFYGHRGDRTTDVAFKINIPLWTPRANLTVWMPAVEWFRNTDLNMAECRVLPEHREAARKGHESGDVYLSIDMHLLTERKFRPDITVRAALKTASGNAYYLARYYDSPGYFFDASIAKSFALGRGPMNHRLRVVLSAGFLCWQTDNGRQNDATMFGAMLKYENRRFSVSQSFSGYSGWEHTLKEGGAAHDIPVTLRTNFSYRIRSWEIVAVYQYGLRDWPYQQVRIGFAKSWDILKRGRKVVGRGSAGGE